MTLRWQERKVDAIQSLSISAAHITLARFDANPHRTLARRLLQSSGKGSICALWIPKTEGYIAFLDLDIGYEPAVVTPPGIRHANLQGNGCGNDPQIERSEY
jgi:hypothetical protein